jgi:hypothetical protein
MAEVSQKARKRLRDLHARLGSNNSSERESAWRKIDTWLGKHGKTWNDLPELLYDETAQAQARTDPRNVDPKEPIRGKRMNISSMLFFAVVALIFGLLQLKVILWLLN